MAIRFTNWRTKDGKRRVIRLYKAYLNMKCRVAGHVVDGNGKARWKGLRVGFRDWEHFREWSIKNGYKRKGMALDRIREDDGYAPENCQWITQRENAAKARQVHRPGCMCFYCEGRTVEPDFGATCAHGRFLDECEECAS